MREKKYKEGDLDYAIICKNCGHVKDMHDFDDYSGYDCIEENCECNNFDAKTDEDMNVLYDL